MRFVIAGISGLIFVAWIVARIVLGVQFDINCENYISQAASSPSPSVAASRLDTAISYIEYNHLTDGNTGIFLTYPTNDLGFWYKRLVDSRSILRALPANDSALETSNTMMRVHEAFSYAQGGVLYPYDISVFPHNALFFWWAIASFFATIGFGIWAIAGTDI